MTRMNTNGERHAGTSGAGDGGGLLPGMAYWWNSGGMVTLT